MSGIQSKLPNLESTWRTQAQIDRGDCGVKVVVPGAPGAKQNLKQLIQAAVEASKSPAVGHDQFVCTPPPDDAILVVYKLEGI